MKLLTTAQAARESGLSVHHIKHACASGAIRAQKIGKTWVFTPDDFDEWYSSRRKPGNPNFKPRE